MKKRDLQSRSTALREASNNACMPSRLTPKDPQLAPVERYGDGSGGLVCGRCGLDWPDDAETLEPHECPPGFSGDNRISTNVCLSAAGALSDDPTTASIEARNDERAQLRDENLRLSCMLVEAYTEIEVLKAVKGHAPWSVGSPEPEPPRSPGPWWPGLVARLNALRKKLDGKPRELRRTYDLQPGDILHAYREGDLSFDEARDILDSVEFSEACAARRRA